MLSRVVREYYRCPDDMLAFAGRGKSSSNLGYFKFGDSVCFGSLLGAVTAPSAILHDAREHVTLDRGIVTLPFDPEEVIDNLRLERYATGNLNSSAALRKIYYRLRPLTNRFIRTQIQRFHARDWQRLSFPKWPVDTTVENICETLLLLSMEAQGLERMPFIWFWPGGARGCVMMTHDIEEAPGRDFCNELMDIDDAFGIKASFQIVPEGRYEVSADFLAAIRGRGFEIAIQDLNHDGRMFDDRDEFLRRLSRIHRYASEYGARGFRSAVLYRNPEWYDAFTVSFDMSIPNVAHLDPQRGGCCTVMPYFIGNILELPLTTAQDYTLFHLLNQRSIDLWKTQIHRILEKNGVISFIVHPDYIKDADTKPVYKSLLAYLRDLGRETPLWFALPSAIDCWWRARSEMSLIRNGNSWRISGEGAEDALLAFARKKNGKLIYELAQQAVTA